MTYKPVIEVLQQNAARLTNKQRQLGSYIIANYQKVAFMNSRDLARNADVSESTVVRLVSGLGYHRYTDFQKELQNILRSHINSLETLERYEAPPDNKRNAFYDVFSLEQTIISEALENIDENIFNTAVELLYEKQHVVLLGSGGDEVVAGYVSKFLHLFRSGIIDLYIPDDIRLVQCMNICNKENAVVLAYSTPRYYKRTLNLVSDLRDKGIKIIGVTDSKLAPLALLSDCLFVTPIRYITMVDPLCSVITLTHALLNGIAARNPEKVRKRVSEYYEYTKRMDICVMDNIAVCI